MDDILEINLEIYLEALSLRRIWQRRRRSATEMKEKSSNKVKSDIRRNPFNGVEKKVFLSVKSRLKVLLVLKPVNL